MRRIATILCLLAGSASASAQTLVPGDPILADRSTETCYSCHDETRRDSHPVQIAYDAGARRRSAGLRSASTIPSDLLVDGRVECVSCHFVHAEETTTRYRLRIPQTSTQPGYTGLCVSCHEIDAH
ncbi:MAG: hypothetical protein ACXV5L_06985 [Thermoanaerobaculia bacterium]